MIATLALLVYVLGAAFFILAGAFDRTYAYWTWVVSAIAWPLIVLWLMVAPDSVRHDR